MFKKLEGDTAVVVQKGAYKQGDLYEWQGGLFVRIGSSFYRLKADGATSHIDIKLCAVALDKTIYSDRFGRLCTEPGEDRKPLLAAPEGGFIEVGTNTKLVLAAE